jgi:predicted nucleotidyltransferase component of viral defense system
MMVSKDLVRFSLATGLPTKNVEKEIKLFTLMPKFFHLLEERKIKAALFGGTALNKGYYAEKQRFSKDLDIDCFSRNWKSIYNKITEALLDSDISKEYRVETAKFDIPSTIKEWTLWYGKNPWENLLIEMNIKQVAIDRTIKSLPLHSFLEFHGMILTPVYVPSYSLEHLLARKILALARRQVGKDIYDGFMGFKHSPDRVVLRAYVGALAKSEWKTDFSSFVEPVIHWLDRVTGGTSDVVELAETVPLNYREDIKTMIESIKFELRRLE